MHINELSVSVLNPMSDSELFHSFKAVPHILRIKLAKSRQGSLLYGQDRNSPWKDHSSLVAKLEHNTEDCSYEVYVQSRIDVDRAGCYG